MEPLPDVLVKEHLEQCNYKVCGYWDEQDKYYETVTLPRELGAELVSSSIGVSHKERFLKLKFLLTASTFEPKTASDENIQTIGELELVYDENLKFIDERWFLNTDSPMIQIN
ncbi:hypothetical protein NOS3756_22080 [Nostoc sp. NIES-3756]|uniref:hypothetical protein n=1 Tax=Nostoc sp. NIES-3756 TaxID=1751286 RepID=UPI00072160A1|nr:hypothetical protein [Nostoc sp. NIES-3756]BAT53249.1 hypothetical protein NOS3756_22080 [Nostoc sp. NIES-3756]